MTWAPVVAAASTGEHRIALMTPAELSARFVEAYNGRDADAMREMLAADLTYVRPGPTPLRGIDAVMAQYDEDWERYDAVIQVRRILEQDDTAAVELTLSAPSPQGTVEVEGVVLHRWVDGRMVDYRFYVDPVPQGL